MCTCALQCDSSYDNNVVWVGGGACSFYHACWLRFVSLAPCCHHTFCCFSYQRTLSRSVAFACCAPGTCFVPYLPTGLPTCLPICRPTYLPSSVWAGHITLAGSRIAAGTYHHKSPAWRKRPSCCNETHNRAARLVAAVYGLVQLFPCPPMRLRTDIPPVRCAAAPSTGRCVRPRSQGIPLFRFLVPYLA